jgi:hypothetical protein
MVDLYSTNSESTFVSFFDTSTIGFRARAQNPAPGVQARNDRGNFLCAMLMNARGRGPKHA